MIARLRAHPRLSMIGLALIGLGWADDVLSWIQNLQFVWDHRGLWGDLWEFLGGGAVKTLLTIVGFVVLGAGVLRPPRVPALAPSDDAGEPLPIEVESDGQWWKYNGGYPIPFCKAHDTTYLFKAREDGTVRDLADYQIISKGGGRYCGALFCGGNAGHLEYFATDPRKYEQAKIIVRPMLAAVVRARRQER
ncbi:MAG: hypothetical protein AB7N24_18720 [Dehalococcoidia bacterium]